MPNITDSPPANVQADLLTLSNQLDQEVPEKSAENLLIATWNIRSFASLTREWTAGEDASPKRDLRGLRAIIEVLSRFDVIAIQEVKGDLRALRDTLRLLGPSWGFLMTDVNLQPGGNNERLAFLFHRDRVHPSGLAAEIVVPRNRRDIIGPEVLNEQFARSPYAVSFQRGEATFILLTLHVLFGQAADDRLPEILALADWMHDWARRTNRFHQSLLTLGDFNIDRKGDPLFDAFTSQGLFVPDVLLDLPRTIFDDPGESDDDSFFDQIAWFQTGSGALLNLEFRTGGNFNFLQHVYTDTDLSRGSVSFRVSDHLPLWVEFML